MSDKQIRGTYIKKNVRLNSLSDTKPPYSCSTSDTKRAYGTVRIHNSLLALQQVKRPNLILAAVVRFLLSPPSGNPASAFKKKRAPIGARVLNWSG